MQISIDKQARTAVQPNRLRMAFILGALTGFGPLTIDMYLPALPGLTAQLQTTASLTQLSLTACLLGLALGQIVAGPISDARGRKKPLMIALVVYMLASLFCAMAPSIWMLVIFRFIQGVGGAAGLVISRAIVRDMYSGTELTKFFSLLMLINGVAPIAAPVVGGQLIQFVDWRGIFLVLMGLGVVMLLAVLTGMNETLPASKRSKGDLKHTLVTYFGLFKDRAFMGYSWAQGLVMAAMFAYISGSPFVVQDIYGVSPQGYSLVFAVNAIGIIASAQITGRLTERLGETKLLKFGLWAAALSALVLLVMILLGGPLLSVLIPLFFVVSSVGIVSTTCFSLAMEKQAHQAGSAAAVLGLIPFIFGSIVAPLVGIGGSHTAVPMGIVIALTDLGALLCYFGLVRQKRA